MIKFISMNISKKIFLAAISLSSATIWAQNAPVLTQQPSQDNSAETILQSMDGESIQPAAPQDSEIPAPIVSSDTSNTFAPIESSEMENNAVAEPAPEYVDPNAPVPVSESAELLQPMPKPEPMPMEEPSYVEPAGISFIPTDSAATQTALQPVEEIPAAENPELDQTAESIWDTTPAMPLTQQEAESIAEQPVQATAEKHVLDIFHGRAYNAVGNEAAAANVAGEISMPHKMHNRKFVYIEPVDGYGVVSFGEGSTFFLAFDNNKTNAANYSELGLVTLGYAGQNFGFSLEAATGKSWSYIDNDIDSSSTTYKITNPGTQFGGTASANLANIDLALGVTYANPNGSYFISEFGEEHEKDEWALGGKLTVAHTTSNALSWSVNLNFLRYKASTSSKTESIFTENGETYKATYKSTVTDTTTRVEVIPEFNVGAPILQNQKARVFLGLNTAVPLIAYDRIDGVVSRHNEYGLTLTPNVLAEVALGQYVMAFGSVSYCWDVADYRDSYINNVSVKALEMESGETTAILGMRLQYEFAALEMAFTKQFLQNPFGSFSDHDEIAMSIGAFVNF
ncbi:hypothetical protein [Fibrobacter sp. HC4]|uniref:hypothetical protein n=1 Tax=Fibrobacter sp. HC4 TaxID=3239812 RepID=UPI000DC5AA43|nr:hypothetical protein [Fibrobacter succinogenes]MCL4102947.1 hypothetical protein [Fibrobacter succinogenes]